MGGWGQGSNLLFTTKRKIQQCNNNKERLQVWASVCIIDKLACPWSGLSPAIFFSFRFFIFFGKSWMFRIV